MESGGLHSTAKKAEIYMPKKTESPKVKGKHQPGHGHPNKQSLRIHGNLGISNSSLIMRHSQNKFNGTMYTNESFVNLEEPADAAGFNLFTHQQKRKNNQELPLDYACLREAVLELFLSVKIRSDEEIEKYNKDTFGKEKEELKDVDGYLLIDYIKQSIEMLMNMKMEESQKHRDFEDQPKKKVKNTRRYKDIEEPEINIKMPRIDSKNETIPNYRDGEEEVNLNSLDRFGEVDIQGIKETIRHTGQ